MSAQIRSPIAYRELIGGEPLLLAFQTVTELRFGALVAGWGELRRRRMERSIASLSVVQPDNRTLTICAELRHQCHRIGHPLGGKPHEADRWIASTAIRLGLSLVSDDGIFVRSTLRDFSWSRRTRRA